MSVLTLAMLKEAMKEIENAPPPLTQIKVGSIHRFKEYIETSLGQRLLQVPKPHGSFAGIPIYVSLSVPENIAVVMRDHEVAYFINFDKDQKLGKRR